MSVGYWIIAGITAFAFSATGLMKLLTPRAKMLANADDPQFAWANDFTEPQIKLIGLAELLGAAGLILPPAVGVAKWLRIPAAIGLILLMLGGALTHRRRKEPFFPPLIPGAFALITLFL